MSGLYSDMVNELREEMNGEQPKDDEFTSKGFYNSLSTETKANISLQAVRCRFDRKCSNGTMEKRKFVVKGKLTTLFRIVDNKKAPEGA